MAGFARGPQVFGNVLSPRWSALSIVKVDVRSKFFNVRWDTVSLTITVCGLGFAIVNSNSLEVGDMIAVARLGYKHVGIYVGPQPFGACVVHNCKGDGVILSTLEEFGGSSQIFIRRKATGNFQERQIIAQRAMFLLGTKYDLLKFNCEHAATTAQSGVPESPQVAVAGLLALFAVGLALLAGKRA